MVLVSTKQLKYEIENLFEFHMQQNFQKDSQTYLSEIYPLDIPYLF